MTLLTRGNARRAVRYGGTSRSEIGCVLKAPGIASGWTVPKLEEVCEMQCLSLFEAILPRRERRFGVFRVSFSTESSHFFFKSAAIDLRIRD